jgi:hypothetical protein
VSFLESGIRQRKKTTGKATETKPNKMKNSSIVRCLFQNAIQSFGPYFAYMEVNAIIVKTSGILLWWCS